MVCSAQVPQVVHGVVVKNTFIHDWEDTIAEGTPRRILRSCPAQLEDFIIPESVAEDAQRAWHSNPLQEMPAWGVERDATLPDIAPYGDVVLLHACTSSDAIGVHADVARTALSAPPTPSTPSTRLIPVAVDDDSGKCASDDLSAQAIAAISRFAAHDAGQHQTCARYAGGFGGAVFASPAFSAATAEPPTASPGSPASPTPSSDSYVALSPAPPTALPGCPAGGAGIRLTAADLFAAAEEFLAVRRRQDPTMLAPPEEIDPAREDDEGSSDLLAGGGPAADSAPLCGRVANAGRLAQGVERDPESGAGLAPRPRRNRGKANNTPKLYCHFCINPDMLALGFDLPKRIIGRDGCNTSRINVATGAKVRLRGRGSGHEEAGREAKVPLMLAVTLKRSQSSYFEFALRQSVDLLRRVADQFTGKARGNLFWVGDLEGDEFVGDSLRGVPRSRSSPHM